MKIITVALLSFLFTGSHSALLNTIKETPVANYTVPTSNQKNWKPLFDGKTTKGWHTYGKNTAGARWQVVDGTLMIDSSVKEGGDLVTDGEYENFDLKIEWKISANGNSGIIFNIKEDADKYKETYRTGPEVQVLDNVGHSDGQITKHRAGDLYDLIKSSSEPVKPFGEWNAVEIISNKGRLEIFLNGTNVVTTTMWDDNWKQLIANSKFKDMPDFGTFKKGRIALQDHGNTVWYRNINIKKL